MTLSELIAAVGDDNVTFQTIATDMKSANIYGSKGQVTFYTSPKMVMDMLNEEPEYIGLIVWIPKALAEEVTA